LEIILLETGARGRGELRAPLAGFTVGYVVSCAAMAAQKSAGEILEAVVEDGYEELGRASTGLALSGLAAGLNVSFGAMALGVVGAAAGGSGILSALFYPIGFLIVIMGRSQLFTENTITPVAVVLTRFGSLPNMLRLWAVVFVFNLLGAIAFAAAVVYGDMLRPTAFQVLFDEVATKLEYGFLGATFRAVLGGWLVALMVWLVAASKDTISQIFFVYVLALLIPLGGLTHCIAGSTEVLMSVFAGETSFLDYLSLFLLPTTLGNTIGGLILVTLLNYGQVAGSKEGSPSEAMGEASQEDS
jgi:formate/nitrite transporter FocA (FNT family)